MSDEQKHNDPLERLFRKKAEEYDISYREEDWLKLEKQLEARDMKIYYRRRLRWLAAASILILSLIGYYTVQNHNKITELTEQLNQNEAIEQNEPPVNSLEGSALAENETDETFGRNGATEENGDATIPNESETRGQDRESNAFVNSGSESVVAIPEDEFETAQPGDLPRREFAEATQSIRERPVEANSLFPNRSTMLASVSFQNQSVELRKSGSDTSYPPNKSNSGSRSSALLNAPLSPDNSYNLTQPAYPKNSRLAIGLVVSPDLSTVGGVSNFYDPGLKGGILAEYSLSKTFSLISGVAISNVKYKADGDEYNPPRAWNYGVMPDQTTAVCMILDIPVSLKANLFNFDRSRIFATAGLSSYIMINEDYQFQYDGNQAGLDSSWSEATGTRHWFSNAGFSIGIEYDLSPSWSLRAEPHIKVPLKGVGWGDVELYSMGSFVSLNYRFSM